MEEKILERREKRNIGWFFITIIPLLLILGWLWRQGLFKELRTGGFGIGGEVFIVFFTFFLLRKKSAPLFISLLYGVFALVCFSYLAYLDLVEDINTSFEGIIMNAGFIFTLILFLFSILLFTLYPIRKGAEKGDKVCDYQQRVFIYCAGGGCALYYPFTFLWLGVIDFIRYVKTDNPYSSTEFLVQNTPFTYGLLISQLICWILIYIFTRRTNEKELIKWIKERKLGEFNVKKKVIIGFIVLLGICTFFESFRGLWWVWFWTAILLILIFASLWKVWRHVLDVPKEAKLELT